MAIIGALLGTVIMAAVPGYFVLQPMTILRYRGKWRLAAMLPLLGCVPAALYSLYALAQESNLWPIMFVLFAPVGSLYLAALMAAHRYRYGNLGV